MKNVTRDTKKIRGRPTVLDRDAAVEVAEQLFHEIGYDQLGVSAICDAVGVRQPALYRVFGSKAGIFKAALERYLNTSFATFLGHEIVAAKTVTELRSRILLRATQVYTSDSSRKGCMALETAVYCTDETTRRLAAAQVRKTHQAIASQAIELGCKNPAGFADGLLLVLQGL